MIITPAQVSTINFDYCIIGTGMGGTSLVNRLVELQPTAQILIVEAGGKKENNNVKYENVGLRFGMPKTSIIELGGTTNLWHGVCSELDPEDFEKRDWIPYSGWPISYNDLKEFYKEASHFLGIENYNYFSIDQIPEEHRRPIEKMTEKMSAFDLKMYQQPIRVPRLKETILSIAQKSENVHLITDSVALKLTFSEGLATELVVGFPDSSTGSVRAQKFIVAAGALESPRILLNSILDSEAEKWPVAQNIGKFLMDHPMGNLCQIEFKDHQKSSLLSDRRVSEKMRAKAGFKFKAKYQQDLNIPNNGFFIRPSFSKGIDNKTEQVKLALLSLARRRPTLKEMLLLFSSPNLIRQILLYKMTLNVNFKYGDLFFLTEQVPNKESWVGLSESKDQFGYKRAKVNWQLTDLDLLSMDKIFLELRKYFMAPDYEFTHQLKDLNWKDTLTSAAHHCGTMRMSESSKEGVVDKNLLLFGSRNVFICDASVFSTAGNVNAGLTICALAHRLAKYLAGIQ